MDTIRLPNSDLDVSRMCCGAMQLCYLSDDESRRNVLDAYVEGGGRFFDTAHCYCFWIDGMNGKSEPMLGEYLRKNLGRDEYVLATKGGHPRMEGYRDPGDRYLEASVVAKDLDESLLRLGMDYVDLLWLHRDDPRIPAGEIIETLNEEINRGRIRACGASNWTASRIAEANDYAAEHGLKGFCASQPSWSLGCKGGNPVGEERLEPGVLLALDETDYEWHLDSQLPVIAYNSTARGFFARGGKEPENYVNELSLKRYEKVAAMAGDKGLSCNQLAVAWLMNQPFPVVPILGTSNADHMRDAMGAASVELSAQEVNYLACGVIP